MRNLPFSQFVRAAAALLVPFIAGCGGGDGVSVSGTVTFNGNPVEKGYITFHPADSKGRSVAGEVSGGKFSVKNVPAGKCRVEVLGAPTGEGAESMGDGIKDAKGAKESHKDQIAPNSEGNNQVHEIASGTQLTLNLKTSDSMGAPSKAKPSSSMGALPKR